MLPPSRADPDGLAAREAPGIATRAAPGGRILQRLRPSRGCGAHDEQAVPGARPCRALAHPASSARTSSSRAAASGRPTAAWRRRARRRAWRRGRGRRRRRHRRGTCRRTPAGRRGARARQSRQAPWCTSSPMAARPKIRVSTARKVALPAMATSVRRSSLAWSNRMVGCGSQARRAPSPSRGGPGSRPRRRGRGRSSRRPRR